VGSLSPERQAIVDRAARLTREKIAPRAAHYDATGTNPVESWRDLWSEGLLACAVPRAFGGLGIDMPTYAATVRTIAQGCASTAMTLHMHSTVMRFIDALGTESQKRRYFAEVVERGRLFGSWGSEPAVSLSRTLLFETVIREEPDGWAIDGTKHFCTMALGASYYMIWGALDGRPEMAKSVLLALVPAETPGLSTDGKWDTLGMRATFSPSVTLAGVRVPADAVLGDPGSALRVGIVEVFPLGYAAIFLGIAQAALGFAAEYSRTRMVRPENVPVAHDPAVQRHVGELAAHLDAALLVLEQSADRWETGDLGDKTLLANRAKYLATEAALLVTSKVIQIVGGRGAYKAHLAERAFRDVRTCTLMPPTIDRMLEAIGKNTLGLDAAMFNLSEGAANLGGGLDGPLRRS
jgi:alkylation response protein AidB-like acyl-CoA dehydrogenase